VTYPTGDNNKLSKLSSEDVKEILRRVSKGEKQVLIAKDYDVHESLISHIKRGVKWSCASIK